MKTNTNSVSDSEAPEPDRTAHCRTNCTGLISDSDSRTGDFPQRKFWTCSTSETPRFWELCQVVGKWVWIQFQQKQPPQITAAAVSAWLPLEPEAAGLAASMRPVSHRQPSRPAPEISHLLPGGLTFEEPTVRQNHRRLSILAAALAVSLSQINPRTTECLLDTKYRRQQDVQLPGFDFLDSAREQIRLFGEFFLSQVLRRAFTPHFRPEGLELPPLFRT